MRKKINTGHGEIIVCVNMHMSLRFVRLVSNKKVVEGIERDFNPLQDKIRLPIISPAEQALRGPGVSSELHIELSGWCLVH